MSEIYLRIDESPFTGDKILTLEVDFIPIKVPIMTSLGTNNSAILECGLLELLIGVETALNNYTKIKPVIMLAAIRGIITKIQDIDVERDKH